MVECGYTAIVHLLLHDFGVFTYLTNRQGHIVFQLARAEEMKQLFHRPRLNGNRFCGNEIMFTIYSDRQDNNNQNISSKWTQGFNYFTDIQEYHAEYVFSYYDNPVRRLSNIISFNLRKDETRTKQTDMLLNLVNQYTLVIRVHFARKWKT